MSSQTDQQLADRLIKIVQSYKPTLQSTATSYVVTQDGRSIELPKLGSVSVRSSGTRR